MRGFSKRYHEKNWVPYIVDDDVFLITDWAPHVRILRMGNVNSYFEISEFYLSDNETEGLEYGEIRGRTPLLKNPHKEDGWYYGFIHSSLSNYKGFDRFYFHTIVRINHKTKKIEYHRSPLPCTEQETDEEYNQLWLRSNNKQLKVIFPIGIMYHDTGILISAGIDDVSNTVETYSWEQIETLLCDLGCIFLKILFLLVIR